MRRIGSLVVATVVWGLGACARETAPAPPTPVAELPAINTDAILADIRALSDDAFEGRAPGTPGEQRTVDYLTKAAAAIGLEPGNPDGTWVQPVPLVGLTPAPEGPMVVRRGSTARAFRIPEEMVAVSRHVDEQVTLDGSELVFAGYGVQAPEFQWDDFKGLDVKGKTIIVLVNDPPVPVPTNPAALDATMFGGVAMTYYGRWTYKYERAAELGAAGVLIVHETAAAGYPYSVVQGMGRERFSLAAGDGNRSRAAIEGWLSVEAATALLKMAGQDYQAIKARAATRDFRPVPLGMTASVSLRQRITRVQSRNVVARLSGSDPARREEHVIYTAHWDHLGVGAPVNGDRIYNGALDNASGVAMALEIARAFKKFPTAPPRTILFLFVTAEEQGLLGSEYYAEHPLYPLAKALAVINLDGINPWGPTRDLTVVGLGASDLDGYARDAAAEAGRVLTPDAEPEKGFYYRSDHFNFAKKGVPAFDPDSGTDYIGRPADYGRRKRDEYTTLRYHAPSDEVDPAWDLSGAAEDARIFLAMGDRIARANRFPAWAPGNEFRRARERMMTTP